MKTAVVLLNLGGPLREADIRPFLFNFFMDKNIIGAPLPVRWAIAQYISRTRSKGAAHEAYKALGFRSPLMDNTMAQAAALKDMLSDTEVFVSMRYWHPLADATARAVKAYAPDEIVLLTLYPQYSTTTVKSSLEDWARAAKQAGLNVPTRTTCCWFLNEGFIAASAEKIGAVLKDAPSNTRLLFSAHGLPEKIIESGDPYQWQCEQSATAIAAKLGVTDWQICYQSRVGPLKWIGPSTDEALEQAAQDGVGVVVYPHAFVSEHVETLVEIEMEYRAKAKALGIPYFARVETVGTHPAFIAGLAEVVRGGSGGRKCPVKFEKCAQQKHCHPRVGGDPVPLL